ncbi:MAG: glycerol kinase [Gaiellales bacterium]|jgi:glycerol kinase|nr:glycerol kinase [Gaiellales bacterium]
MILAIDQGTSGTTCLVVDGELRVRGRGHRALETFFPQPGLVEQDPDTIWQGVVEAAGAAVADAGIAARELQAIGITNQRETTVLWERRSSRPVGRAIVWQDRRTAERCARLPRELVRARTGLVPDPYFSASKLEWLLAQTPLRPDTLAFGTVDSWLVWKLTDGQTHAIDHTNASRTMLLDLERLEWDDELLALFSIDRSLLPALHPSSGVIAEGRILGQTLPIAGIAGDQQAALFGQCCFHPGQAKATYGTGSFVLAHVGAVTGPAPEGLLKTAVAVAPGGTPEYALEGAILASGAAIQWLRDGLGLISEAADSETLALHVDSSDGVYFVPALTGLGSPYWDPEARGLISGITRGTTREHIARAALEAIAFQVADVIATVPGELEVLRADGGATANRFLMQFQADVLGQPVDVAFEQESTALGAAALAALAVGLVPDVAALEQLRSPGVRYEPGAGQGAALRAREGWRTEIARARLR